jgi:rod shape-determining protein MreC
VRLIVYGRGDTLELRDIPLSAGVEVGDEIVTSGLGGRFPAGFPVGSITALRPDDTHAFLVGELKPAAQLDRGRDVLLLRPGEAIRIPPNLRRDPSEAGGPAAAPLQEGAPGGTAATTSAAPASSSPAPTVPAAAPANAPQANRPGPSAPVPVTAPRRAAASPAPVPETGATPPEEQR